MSKGIYLNNTFAIFLEPLILRARCARKIKGSRKMAKVVRKNLLRFELIYLQKRDV